MTILSQEIRVRIDGSNRTRLEEAARTKTNAQLHFQPGDFQPPETGPEEAGFHLLTISSSQHKRLISALKSGSHDIVITLPISQIKQQGGSLGSLIGAVMPMIMKFGPQLLGTAALGLTGGVAQALGQRVGNINRGAGVGDAIRTAAIAGDRLLATGPLHRSFNFSKTQISRIVDGIKNKKDFVLRLLPNQLTGPHAMPMNGAGFTREVAHPKRVDLHFSGAGLAADLAEYSAGQTGGQVGGFAFLAPLLAGLIGPLIGSAMSGSGVDSKKSRTS